MPGTSGLAATRAILSLDFRRRSPDAQHAFRRDAGSAGHGRRRARLHPQERVDLDLAAAVKRVAAGETVLDPAVVRPAPLAGERNRLTPRELEVLQLICDGLSNREIAARLRAQRQHRRRAPRQHHEHARRAQDRRARRLRAPARPGQPAATFDKLGTHVGQWRAGASSCDAAAASVCPCCRRRWLASRLARPASGSSTSPPPPGCSSGTTAARTAASCCRRRSAPAARSSTTTPTAGRTSCWSTAWTGRATSASGPTLKLYRNNRNGTFTDVTRAAGLDVEMYGMGVAVGDFNNDGFPDVLRDLRRAEPAVPQHRQGHVRRRHAQPAASADATAFSTSAMWIDFDRDGFLDLFVCNYVRWSAEHDVFCSLDGKQKSYCTPEAYRGETCWLFRNRGNGTFEDVTATCGIFDSSSKSLGVALLDHDQRRLAGHLRRQRHAAEQALSQPAQRHVQGRRRSKPGSRSATTARRAPAWASTPPTSTTPARRAWPSRTSTAR